MVSKSKSKINFENTGIIAEKYIKMPIFRGKDREKIRVFYNLPPSCEFVIPQKGDRPDMFKEGWITLFDYPFCLGLSFPFPRLIREFLLLHKVPLAQILPNAWKVLASLVACEQKLGIQFDWRDLSTQWKLKSTTNRVTLRCCESVIPPILNLDCVSEKGWQERFIFVKIDTLGLEDSSYLFSKWNLTDYGDITPSVDGLEKVKLILQLKEEDRTFPSCLPKFFPKGPYSLKKYFEEPTMSTSFHTPKLSVKELMEKRLRKKENTASSEETDSLPPLPKKNKTTSASSPASRTRARSIRVETIEDDPVFPNEKEMTDLILPENEARLKDASVGEVLRATTKSAYQVLQEVLISSKKTIAAEEKFALSQKELESARKELEAAQKELETAQKRSNDLTLEVIDLKGALAKALEEKDAAVASLGEANAKFQTSMEDTAMQYGMRGRLEMMFDYIQGNASTWDFETEKETFKGIVGEEWVPPKEKCSNEEVDAMSVKASHLNPSEPVPLGVTHPDK